MRFHSAVPSLFLLALLAGPSGAEAPKAGAAAPKAAVPAKEAVKPVPATTSMTGGLSEEEFKALHTLSAEKPPAPLGESVVVGGATCYLSLPKGVKAPMPGIVLIHEWWGLNDNIRHWADRLAAEGYAALAVDLYGGKVATTPDAAMEYMKGVDDGKARKILLAAADFLAHDPRIAATRRGSVGWCFGGGQSLQLALAEPALDAAVIYYGHLVTDPTELAQIHAAVLGIFGNQDKAITPESVNAFESGLERAGVRHEIFRYDAPHAFANPSGPAYNETAAAAAWEQVRAFLARNLQAPK